MNLVYLADTNVISELMRPRPAQTVLDKWRQHRNQIAISSITWHELLTGIGQMPSSKKKSALEEFLQSSIENIIPILPYDKVAARWHALERARLTRLGRTPSFADGQIAAVAAAQNLSLVTNNTSDFINFDLSIENWLS